MQGWAWPVWGQEASVAGVQQAARAPGRVKRDLGSEQNKQTHHESLKRHLSVAGKHRVPELESIFRTAYPRLSS